MSRLFHSALFTRLKQPPWRTVVPLAVLLLIGMVGYVFWTPGTAVRDGKHDRGRNGIWLQHGWLGDDAWFRENNRTDRYPKFRDHSRIQELAAQLRKQHITDVFPHLCPTQPTGEIMGVDDKQTRLFLQEFTGFRVLPWIGGVFDDHIVASSPERRKLFVQSAVALLERYPEFAGVHLNVEPWPTGNQDMLRLLEELRAGLPEGKILSVAAYPPPTVFHMFPEVHWEADYYKAIAARVDQLAIMMYDTALRDPKLYQVLMQTWTRQIIDWTTTEEKKPPEVLLGVATYDDAGVAYHDPRVENLTNGLRGIHAGLSHYSTPPPHYQGVAIYCEWEMDDSEWNQWQTHFCSEAPKNR